MYIINNIYIYICNYVHNYIYMHIIYIYICVCVHTPNKSEAWDGKEMLKAETTTDWICEVLAVKQYREGKSLLIRSLSRESLISDTR